MGEISNLANVKLKTIMNKYVFVCCCVSVFLCRTLLHTGCPWKNWTWCLLRTEVWSSECWVSMSYCSLTKIYAFFFFAEKGCFSYLMFSLWDLSRLRDTEITEHLLWDLPIMCMALCLLYTALWSISKLHAQKLRSTFKKFLVWVRTDLLILYLFYHKKITVNFERFRLSGQKQRQ